jgi:hypothetical protein
VGSRSREPTYDASTRSRSRKRRGTGASAPPAAPKQRAPRYGESTPAPAPEPAPAPGDAMRRGYARGEERNQRIREQLEPLAPGERPGAVTVAAIVAVLLGLANLVSVLRGDTVGGDDARGVALALTVVIFVAAAGMWKAQYWAVLGFQALLTLQLIICFLLLLTAPDVWRALLLAVLLGLGSWLFWKLVRAMARLQMPVR